MRKSTRVKGHFICKDLLAGIPFCSGLKRFMAAAAGSAVMGCKVPLVRPPHCESCVTENDLGPQKPDCSSWTLAILLAVLNAGDSAALCLPWQDCVYVLH